jgi:hypothetical protein
VERERHTDAQQRSHHRDDSGDAYTGQHVQSEAGSWAQTTANAPESPLAPTPDAEALAG